ncbi:symmetrical bis(5'-nucleosyl)-tetraphosphatase [Salinisphaera sp. USBA-960]|uniref:symmetrical bis(5'-nucleosyl)-tetraphosphatase n=1 Tax=Salinisphaera orenii TaxID=856731 RepID=UPI000DBE0D0C|nr:symmetrical bis(5'-nucleosyl)-tetraphosphatase [Salifodinibacter halophilus]NNC26665.1 symmetrical bis(5'-nucleosyl)-tetraphosphatase [Salifodinibacter halophilus]
MSAELRRIFCIGDVHGQYAMLDRLLHRLDAIDANAELWFVGDLVNRGPDSASVVRRVRELGSRATTVLGNHDLSVLAMAADASKRVYADTGVARLLAADDASELLDWLRTRPLLHQSVETGWTMVHAGIPKGWDLTTAAACAAEFEQALTADDWQTTLNDLYGNEPTAWAESLTGIRRLRYIANALTRQRFCHAGSGDLDLSEKGRISDAPATLTPWFAEPNRKTHNERIVFGHWSMLGRIAWPEHNAWCIDTGASWQGVLSALELRQHPRLIQAD